MKYQYLYKVKYSEYDRYEQEYKNRYNNVSTYHYDFKIGTNPVFVVVTPEILQSITNIQRLDKQLYILEERLPGVALGQFKQKSLIDEVKQTNELEGVASTRKEIKEVLYNMSDKNNRLYGIVQKYALLMTSVKVPLNNCQDIRNLYDDFILTEVKNTNEKNIPDGDIFRKDQVYVQSQSTGQIVHKGVYPETKIIETMSSLLTILNNPEYNPFINIAVIHYMFGYIHPFYDGNGRMSRFISSYLISKQIEQLVGFRIAYTIKKDIKKYYKMFEITNDKINRGDLTPFTMYFLELIETSLEELIYYFTDQLKKLKFYNDKINHIGLKSNEYTEVLFIAIQATIFGGEGIDIKELCKAIKKSDTTTRKIVKQLCADNLLLGKQSRPVLYNANLDKISEL